MFVGGLKTDLRDIVMDTSPKTVIQEALTAKDFENHDEKDHISSKCNSQTFA